MPFSISEKGILFFLGEVMASTGLTEKRFIGKIVNGFDPDNRGRYYVHVPDLIPHLPETKGILAANAIHTTRMDSAGVRGGGYGTYSPLYEGTTVEVSCQTDDISSARIVAIVSDDQSGSDMSPGKTTGVEPSGHIDQIAVKGEDDPTNPSSMFKEVQDLLASGSMEALQLLGPVLNKLNNIKNGLTHLFKDALKQIPGGDKLPIDQVINKIPAMTSSKSRSFGFDLSSLSIDAFDLEGAKKKFADLKKMAESLPQKMEFGQLMNNISNGSIQSSAKELTSIADKLSGIRDAYQFQDALGQLRDVQAEAFLRKYATKSRLARTGELNFDSLSSEEQDVVNISLGQLNEQDYLNQKASDWGKENAANIVNVPVSGEGGTYSREPNGGCTKADPAERDEQHVAMQLPDGTAIYSNMNTGSDPNCFYITFQHKASVLRFSPEGIHISTSTNYRQKITVNRDIEIDGTSSIKVNGGKYDIYVEGSANIVATQDVGINAGQNIKLTAGNNIELSAGNQILQKAGGGGVLTNSEGAVITESQGEIAFKTQGGFIVQSDGGINSFFPKLWN